MKTAAIDAGAHFGEDVIEAERPILQTRSLREQVYDYLRGEMIRGGLKPGSLLDLNAIAERLGISRTPLRGALLQLEMEGYMETQPRRGFKLKMLSLDEIRNIYQIVGALEAAAVVSAGPRLGKAGLAKMKAANKGIQQAIKTQDYKMFDAYNATFHEVFLDECENPRMVRLIHSMKQRLNDWPPFGGFLKNWEVRGAKEHHDLISLLEAGKFADAGHHLREVHWSFERHEEFIRLYYQTDRPA